MIAVETTQGRFEAETEREALKLARKAKREAAKEEAKNEARREQARLFAQANAYHVLERFLEAGHGRRGWHLAKPDEAYFPRVKRDHTLIDYRPYDTMHYEFQKGRADFEHYGCTCEAIAYDGAGFAMVTFLKDNHTGAMTAYAVGGFENQVALVALPKITPEFFEKGE